MTTDHGAPAGTPASRPPGATGRRWALSGPQVWVLGAGLVLLALGALAGRPDVAVLAVAPVVTTLWAVWVRPRGEIWADVERVGEGLSARLRLTAPPGTDAVRLRVGRVGHGATEALVDVPLVREMDLTAASVRTGPQDLFMVEHQGIGGGGALSGPVGARPADRVLVLPRALPLPGLPLPPRLRGLSGQHRSRRPGEGGDLRDVHPFGPGDTLRRVDWKATARHATGRREDELYVRRSLALGEAAVTLVVDSRDDVGPDPATWSGVLAIRPDDASSLDLARIAAATVAQAYLGAGDRVGVEDLGVQRRALRAGTGRRHLDRVVHQLATLAPEGDPPHRLRPPRLPAAGLVYLFSTFLDPEAATLALTWRRSGHRVVAVDVLPRLRRGRLDQRGRLALRMVRIEREDRMVQMVTAGVEVVPWAGSRPAERRWTLRAGGGSPVRGMGEEAATALLLLSRVAQRRPGRAVGR